MLHSLPKHPVVARTLNEAASILQHDVLKLDSGSALGSTAHVQVALLISSVAVSRLLQSEGAHPDMVGGLSVGAFGAAVTSPLYVAGVNAPRQIVVSGSEPALEAISEPARLAGATKVMRLQGVSKDFEALIMGTGWASGPSPTRATEGSV